VKSPSELAEAFRARGLEVTSQRQRFFSLLEDDATHPTAEGLYVRASAQMPGISLRTVCTTLADLVAMGELQAVALGTGATRFDPNVDDHHHGVCDDCGSIIDLYVGGSDSLVVDGGFTPQSASIVFHVSCAECAATGTNPDPNPSPDSTPESHKEHHHG
jgi:Fe2+ or Zn2+ uptake regulation protein